MFVSAVRRNIVLITLTLCTATTCLADPPKNTNYSEWDAKDLYQHGSVLLSRGRDFNTAIEVLSLAARRVPHNVDYHAILGCAYASRFASVAYAYRQNERFAWEQQRYTERKARWDAAQKDSSHPAFQKPRPVPPSPPVTPDDGKRFHLKPEEVKVTLLSLGKNCQETFETARKLVQTSKPILRSRIEFLRGWGLFVVWRYGKEVVTEVNETQGAETAAIQPSTYQKITLPIADIQSSFKICVKDNPKMSSYWHSYGVSLCPDYMDPSRNGVYADFGKALESSQSSVYANALKALERANDMKNGDFHLLYQLSLMSSSSPDKALEYAEKAQQGATSNAITWYMLAELYFRVASRQEQDTKAQLMNKGFAAVLSGNRSPQYNLIPVVLPVPPPLRAAWNYVDLFGFGNDIHLQAQLGDILKERITYFIEKQQDAEAVEASSLLMGLGLKAARNVRTKAQKSDDASFKQLQASRLNMAMANCYRAYQMLKKAQESRPDPRKAHYLEESKQVIEQLRTLEKEFEEK